MNYPTKQQVKKLKEGEYLRIELIEECLLCGYNDYHGMLCIKVPEMTAFCLDCIDKFHDDNTIGWGVYQIGNGFIN